MAYHKKSVSAATPLAYYFKSVRDYSLSLVKPLNAEDCQIQGMADVSPIKWHLAHTSWFFETFILDLHSFKYQLFDPEYKVLFNSYYNGIGKQFKRAERGSLSRPTLETILAYRAHVDSAMLRLLSTAIPREVERLITLGINHEQQHQELMLMDIKYNFSLNPTFPVYEADKLRTLNDERCAAPLTYIAFDKAIINIGTDAINVFAYDNEQPKHQVLVHPFSFANRLVSNGEYLAFIMAGGYTRAHYWLSDGWAHLQQHNLTQPLYWYYIDEQWFEFGHAGLQPLNLSAPVCHVSYFEANAYANFVNARLPTEFEWELVAQRHADNNSQQQPCDKQQLNAITKLTDIRWQWTNSAYLPYPGFEPITGDAGEYNGKFMSNQMVLRGGCEFTPANHSRITYRNFYYPHQAWMCSGIRLAKDRL
ncbi:ergothioneine biosynthesis protein EgtB [Pseudoalteromonas sp.]|uniref:ergothioneine biosynthesis protein EgtB n=1 Tax=Pseudoalteromonas sp. TaxID=53249 RepID=UPI0035629E04